MSYPGGQNPYDPYSQQPYGQQPYGPYSAQYGGFGGPPPNHPHATTVLVVGLLSVVGGVLCGVFFLAGPVAWVMGQKALREIDASGGALGGRSQVMVGYVCGIIASGLLILAILAVVFVFVFFGGLALFAS